MAGGGRAVALRSQIVVRHAETADRRGATQAAPQPVYGTLRHDLTGDHHGVLRTLRHLSRTNDRRLLRPRRLPLHPHLPQPLQLHKPFTARLIDSRAEFGTLLRSEPAGLKGAHAMPERSM